MFFNPFRILTSAFSINFGNNCHSSLNEGSPSAALENIRLLSSRKDISSLQVANNHTKGDAFPLASTRLLGGSSPSFSMKSPLTNGTPFFAARFFIPSVYRSRN